MVGVIFGQKGSGKTKKILELANKAAKEAPGQRQGRSAGLRVTTGYSADLGDRIATSPQGAPRNDALSLRFVPCHCEERSDVAIRLPNTGKQLIHSH